MSSLHGKLKASEIKLCRLKEHARGSCHIKALQALADVGQVEDVDEPKALDFGVVSGLSEDIPRLDRWVASLTLVQDNKAYQDLASEVASASIASSLTPGGDSSERLARQMVACMAADLSKQDRKMMKAAVKTSISFDKSDETLLVYCRTLSKYGIYDFLLGLEAGIGPLPLDAIGALEKILQRACTEPRGKREGACIFSGSEDHFDAGLHANFLNSVVSAVADGGPVEQKALFLCSPLPLPDASGRELEENQHETIFQNLRMISRDRPHRYRSVQRGFWSNLPADLTDLLDSLVTGPRSLCRLLEQSTKMRKIFVKKQQDAKHQHSAETFCEVMKNFAYSEVRFDSRTRPLYRLFRLLPVVIDALEELTSAGEQADKSWAKDLLLSWSGDAGYVRLVGAAVCADALVMGKSFLQADDAAAADFAICGAEAAELIHRMRCMLVHGGLFEPEAEQTLTHTCLRSIRGRCVFIGRSTHDATAAALRWPAPDTAARREPIVIAQKS